VQELGVRSYPRTVSGARRSEIQGILGHHSLTTTSKIYARYNVRSLREAFDKYSSMPE
jgi:integrase